LMAVAMQQLGRVILRSDSHSGQSFKCRPKMFCRAPTSSMTLLLDGFADFDTGVSCVIVDIVDSEVAMTTTGVPLVSEMTLSFSSLLWSSDTSSGARFRLLVCLVDRVPDGLVLPANDHSHDDASFLDSLSALGFHLVLAPLLLLLLALNILLFYV